MSKQTKEPEDIFSSKDEQWFKRQFAVQFLACWTAKNFDEYVARGLNDRLESPPVEDAHFLARCAWQELMRTLDLTPS